MKMSILEALTLLNLPSVSEVHEQNLSVKKAYKAAALAAHPDREGDKFQMAKINAAYTLLKKHIKPQSPLDFKAAQMRRDEIFLRNEGHVLCGAGIPALKPRDVLIREVFDIRESLAMMPSISPMSEYDKNKAASTNVYFQYHGEDYNIAWWGGRSIDQFHISNITAAGKSGQSCLSLVFIVNSWACGENHQIISNVFRELFKDSDYADGEPENGFSWGRVFNDVMAAIERAVYVTENTKKSQLFGYEMICKSDRYGSGWTIDVEGNKLDFHVRENSSISVFNPFALDVYKPIKSLPSNFKTLDLIKVLINGQYSDYKRNYMHTDDYAYDAAYDSGRGFIENPFKTIKDWIEHRGRKGSSARVYISKDTEVNFGFFMNDSSSLSVVLNNRFPLVDLSADVKYLNEQLRLTA